MGISQPLEIRIDAASAMTGKIVERTTAIMSPVSYTHLRAHETVLDLVCRLLLDKKKPKSNSLAEEIITDNIESEEVNNE